MLGTDYFWYDAAVRRYRGRVVASWISCQQEIVEDPGLACDWLDCFDREIADAWRGAGEPARDGAFQLTVEDGLDGAGFGEFSHYAGCLGRRIPDRHATLVFLRLSRE